MKSAYPLLILDDDGAILKALQDTLTFEGYRCFATSHVKEALDYTTENTLAVVISDQRMAEMSGTRFLQRLRAQQPLCSRVLITGVLVSDMFLEAINQAEIFRCLAKPWTREQLLQVVKESYWAFEKRWAAESSYKAVLELNEKLVRENIQLHQHQAHESSAQNINR